MTSVSSSWPRNRLSIWGLSPLSSLLFVLVDGLTLAWIGSDAVSATSPRSRDWLVALLLLCIAVVFEEGATRIARLKWRLHSELKRDMTSVWSVAAAVALPPIPAVVLMGTIYLHVWWRQRRPTGQPNHRALYNSASVVAACLAAGSAVRFAERVWPDLPWALGATLAVLLAIAVVTVVNRGLITLALMSFGARPSELIGSVEDNLTELSTLFLGGLVAVVAVHDPWLCVLVILPMAMLQRGSFVRELETAAVTDSKTGLMNAVGWEHIAQRELGRARRENYDVSVLIADIDFFKLVNDQHGHLVGDQVLRGLSRTMTAALREYDTVARFGGEEFVAILPDTGAFAAIEIAERIRVRINSLSVANLSTTEDERLLSLSIGVSTVAARDLANVELTDMMVAADRALYRAKGTGRNKVCLADPDEQPTVAAQV